MFSLSQFWSEKIRHPQFSTKKLTRHKQTKASDLGAVFPIFVPLFFVFLAPRRPPLLCRHPTGHGKKIGSYVTLPKTNMASWKIPIFY